MAGVTNKGKLILAKLALANVGVTSGFKLALVTSAVAPTADTNTFSELTEIAAGNGYTSGGQSVSRNTTDWDTFTEDDTNDLLKAYLKDFGWTASGGSIPASGNGARYAVLLDDNATVADRVVIMWWDLGADRSASVGQSITLVDAEYRVGELA